MINMRMGLTDRETQEMRELVIKMNFEQLDAWSRYLSARLEMHQAAQEIHYLEDDDESDGC